MLQFAVLRHGDLGVVGDGLVQRERRVGHEQHVPGVAEDLDGNLQRAATTRNLSEISRGNQAVETSQKIHPWKSSCVIVVFFVDSL